MSVAVGFLISEWWEWLNAWANYPGLEVWKFLNLAIFTLVGIKILKKPISDLLASRRDRIQGELADAQNEKDAALATLADADSFLSRREEDISNIAAHARQEASEEKDRLAMAANTEIEKLKLQGQREVQLADKVARKTLRQFLADRSVQLARATVRQNMRPEDDVRLMTESISGLRRN